MAITQIPFLHFTNWLHFLSCPARRPVAVPTKVSPLQINQKEKISHNLASVLNSYVFLFSFQIKCQKSHKMDCLQGIGPVTTWWNLMADCEYRTCFFLTIWWQNVSTERVFPYNLMADCEYRTCFFLTIWWQIVSKEHIFSLQFYGRLWVQNVFFPYNLMADCEYRTCFSLQFDGRLRVQNVFFPYNLMGDCEYRTCFFLTIWWQIVSTERVFSLQFDGRLWVQNVFFPYNLMADCEYRTCFFPTICKFQSGFGEL
jgi:hypothetical protein